VGTKIKIWDVPQALHRELTSRAGMSLSDYLFNDIREIAGRPTLDELQARLDQRAAATCAPSWFLLAATGRRTGFCQSERRTAAHGLRCDGANRSVFGVADCRGSGIRLTPRPSQAACKTSRP